MNRIRQAYDDAAPAAAELAANREGFLQALDSSQGVRPLAKARHGRRWYVAAMIAACLIIGTVVGTTHTNQLETWIIDGNLSTLKKLNVVLPEKIGDLGITGMQYFDRIYKGEEKEHFLLIFGDYRIIPGTKPLYRSYSVEYSKPHNYEYWNHNGSHGTQGGKDSIHLRISFTEGFKDEDWWTYLHYDPESKKWVSSFTDDEFDWPYEGVRTVEDFEEISYRGATIWIFNFVWRYKEAKPAYYYDPYAQWYDPEIGAAFEVYFSTPRYFSNKDLEFDKNGNLIYESFEEWVRPECVLSKAQMLEYIKEIIDLNR